MTRDSRRWFSVMVMLPAALTVAASLALAVSLATRFHDTNQRRELQQDFNRRITDANRRQSRVLRDLLCLARNETRSNTAATPEQRKRAEDFYRRALQLNGTPACPKHEL